MTRRRKYPGFYIDLNEGKTKTLARIMLWLWQAFPNDSIPLIDGLEVAQHLLIQILLKKRSRASCRAFTKFNSQILHREG